MKKVKLSILLIFICSFLIADNLPVGAKNGMVVSASQLTSQVGVDVMKAGGNAIDAAVATGFALAVTFPQAGNIGGGGFLVAHLKDGRKITIDFRETAPFAAHRDMYLDKNDEVIKGMSLQTLQAVGVPGSVAGLLTAWRYYGSGKMPLKQIIGPAIKLAQNGFLISQGLANSLNNHKGVFSKDSGASAEFIKSNGSPWKAGELLIQKDLSKTLQRIAKHDLNGFYSGKTAQFITEKMSRGKGLITQKDLDFYSPKLRAPIIGNFDNYEIISMGPPSSGGVLLVQMLNMLENFNLDSLMFNSTNYIHLLTEIERRAYADRAEHLGDDDYWNVPIEMLLSKKYSTERTKSISMQKVTPSSEVLAGNLTDYESPETTHYSVVDKHGNAVSITTTLNTAFGSGILVDGAGFFLNNEMDDFSAKPGTPNVFGLVGSAANAIHPNKRPLSSMTPTIVLRDNIPYIIIGSPGGSTIITTVLQTVLNVIAHDMNIQEAVSAPRFHCQWLPDAIIVEPNTLSNDAKAQLESLGHTIAPYKWGYIGQANAILFDGDQYWGGADPRADNAAIGY